MGQDLSRAARFYTQAAGDALASYDLDATMRLAALALECGVQGERFGNVRALQARASELRFDLGTATDYALAAVDTLTPGSLSWCRALGSCFLAFFMIGRVEHAERLIQAFFTATPDPDARGYYLQAGAHLTTFFHVQGLRGATRSGVEKMAPVAAALPSQARGYFLYATAGQALYLEPEPYRALCDIQEAVIAFRLNGDRYGETHSMFYSGLCYYGLGAFDQSEAVLKDARALAVATQNMFFDAVIQLNMGFVLAEQPDAAKQEQARSIGEAFVKQTHLGPAISGAAYQILAQIRLRAGALESAEQLAQLAIEQYKIARMLPYHLWVVPIQIDVLLKLGKASEAHQAAAAAVGLIDKQGGLGFCEPSVRLALARACFADGDAVAGRSALAEALAQVQLRSNKITDPQLRELYLKKPENQQIFALTEKLALPIALTT